MFPRVHGPLGGARTDDGVQFVDEEQDAALCGLDLARSATWVKRARTASSSRVWLRSEDVTTVAEDRQTEAR